MFLYFCFFFICANAQLHFVSLGGFGTGSRLQNTVAKRLSSLSKEMNISFIISPGSNFIEPPIESVNDINWKKRFYDMYNSNNLKVPFYTVLGMHDWNGNITAYAEKSEHNKAVKENFPIWNLPNWWYHTFFHFKDSSKSSLVEGSAESSLGLLFIDTFILSPNFEHKEIVQEQWNYIRDVLKIMSRVFDWTIVVADRAMISSNSKNDNLYLYKTLGRFFNDNKVNLYISGSEPTMEVIEDGEMTFINCGSGGSSDSKTSFDSDKSKFFSNKAGFCHHTVFKDKLVTQFFDAHSGEILYTHTQFTRKKDLSSIGSRFFDASKLPQIKLVDIPEFTKVPIFKIPPVEDFIRVVGTIGCIAFLSLSIIHAYSYSQKFKNR